jgi:hypothetical protein
MFFLKIIDDQDQDQELELLDPDYRSPLAKKLQWRAWAADPEGITGDALMAFVNDELFPAIKELSTGGRQGDRRRVVRDVFEDASATRRPTAWTSCSPIRPSAGGKRTASSRTSPSISRPARRPTCSWP